MSEKPFESAGGQIPPIKSPPKQKAEKLGKAEKKAIILSEEDKKKLIEQINAEYKQGEADMESRKRNWIEQAQQYAPEPNKNTAKDRTLFTMFQTILAAIYDDNLKVTFLPREGGDEEQAKMTTELATYDWDAMDMDVIEYDWTFDTLFFSHGFCLLHEFYREDTEFVPCPEILDPLSLVIDPWAKSVNGSGPKHRGQMRYLYRKLYLTKADIAERGFTKDGEASLTLANQADDEFARPKGLGRDKGKLTVGENQTYQILQGFTVYNGHKILVEKTCTGGKAQRGNETEAKEKILRVIDLGKVSDYWPIAERVINKRSHEFWSDSVPDLVVEVQKSRAELVEASLDTVRAGTYRHFLFNSSKIINPAIFKKPPQGMDKYSPINGDPAGAVQELPRQTTKQDVQWILDQLKQNAEQSTSTPEIQQGVMSQEKKTATELTLVAQKVESRYSMMVKLFGSSAKVFWKLWYKMYQREYSRGKGDKKVVRIMGAGGYEWRTLTDENLKFGTDPDLRIVSSMVSEAKKLTNLNIKNSLLQNAATLQGQDFDTVYLLKMIAEESGMERAEVERLFPKRIEEYEAEEINKQLSANKFPKNAIRTGEDHQFFLNMARRAAETPAKEKYILARIKIMRAEKQNPQTVQERTPVDPSQQADGVGGQGAGTMPPKQMPSQKMPIKSGAAAPAPFANLR